MQIDAKKCYKMPSNTHTIGVQIESVTQIISHRLQGQGPPLQLTNTYERTAVLAASLLTHFTALLVCIKLHSAAGHLHCLTPRQPGKQAFYGGLVKPEFLIIPPKVM